MTHEPTVANATFRAATKRGALQRMRVWLELIGDYDEVKEVIAEQDKDGWKTTVWYTMEERWNTGR